MLTKIRQWLKLLAASACSLLKALCSQAFTPVASSKAFASVAGLLSLLSNPGELVSCGGGPAGEQHRYSAEVEGFLFSSERLAHHWVRLDEFEGEGYERVLTTVRLRDATVVDAYVYGLSGNGSPAHRSSPFRLVPLRGSA